MAGVEEGEMGFVLTDFTFEQPVAAGEHCPDGFNLNERDYYLASLEPEARREREAKPPEEYLRMVRRQGGPDQCKDPQLFSDPGHITMDARIASPGFDLDGRDSAARKNDAESCPHLDFLGPSGETGIDNQVWRVLGCINGYQRGGTIDEYAVSNITDGSRTILIKLTGVDSLARDDAVRVGIFSSHNSVPLDTRGKPVAFSSLSVVENARYHNFTSGVIRDGILEAGPVDIRLDYNGQYLDSEYDFRKARIRLDLTGEETVSGLVGGYWDYLDFYDAYARQATRSGAFFVGFTCPGMYHQLSRLADGLPDPSTGKCRGISTTFRLKGIPAFVIDPPQSTVAQRATGVVGGQP